jgi:hypothetical protein
MRNIFNIFKKKQEPKVNVPVKNHFNSETMTYTINNKEYAITDSQLIKIQAVADDVHLYGWSLEVRWKRQNGEWYNWMTYWNHRVYCSRSSALDAATKVFPHYTYNSNGEHEWRIVPLYKMTEPQYRDYKIDQLLNINQRIKEPKVYEIKAWKVKEDCEIKYERNHSIYKYSKNTLFIQMEDGNIRVVKNSTERNRIIYTHARMILDLIKNEQVEEVNIKNEKWAHPHLCKELKRKIKNKI